MLELRGRQVRQQDLALPGGLSANVFWEITNGQVDGIRNFVAKGRELSFIRRNDNRNDCNARFLRRAFDLPLNKNVVGYTDHV
jgi:hypothetical protein